MDNNNYFNRVLYVGMDYKVPKGGIASFLNTYSSGIGFVPFFIQGLAENHKKD